MNLTGVFYNLPTTSHRIGDSLNLICLTKEISNVLNKEAPIHKSALKIVKAISIQQLHLQFSPVVVATYCALVLNSKHCIHLEY